MARAGARARARRGGCPAGRGPRAAGPAEPPRPRPRPRGGAARRGAGPRCWLSPAGRLPPLGPARLPRGVPQRPAGRRSGPALGRIPAEAAGAPERAAGEPGAVCAARRRGSPRAGAKPSRAIPAPGDFHGNAAYRGRVAPAGQSSPSLAASQVSLSPPALLTYSESREWPEDAKEKKRKNPTPRFEATECQLSRTIKIAFTIFWTFLQQCHNPHSPVPSQTCTV